MNILKKLKLKKALFWFGIAVLILSFFFMMFHAFESISLQAALKNYAEFAQHSTTISDSMESLVRTMGTQLFYIGSSTRLRTGIDLSTFDRISAMRELGQYVSSGSLLQSIYVFNEKKQHVYSTDELFFSAGFSGFGDKQALDMYTGRMANDRMRLQYRLLENQNLLPYPRASYAYLVFELDNTGSPRPGAVMLNLDPAWFREHLLQFPGDSYIIFDQEGHVIASQSEGLEKMAARFLPGVQSRVAEAEPAGYVTGNIQGERYLCFFASAGKDAWLSLRITPYADALPGLSRIRDSAFLIISLTALLFLGALFYTFARIYTPFSHIRRQLDPLPDEKGRTAADPRQAIDRVDRLIASSHLQSQKDALRAALAGQDDSSANLPKPPLYLILLEHPANQIIQDTLAKEDSHILMLRHRENSLLCGQSGAPSDALELCERLNAILGCRCYYSMPIDDITQLPRVLGKLDELLRLRFLYPGQLIFCQTLLSSHREEERYPDEEEARLLSALKAGDAQQTRQHFFTFMERVSHNSYAYILFTLMHLMQNAQTLAPEDSQSEEPLPMEDYTGEAEDIQALYARLSPAFEQIAAYQLSKKQQKVSALADRVSLRLERGYRDAALSAQKIADEMGISGAYLRKQFFEAKGLSVNEALNRVRIGQAEELLVSTQMTVEEIAQEIGFDNTKYMFVLFKRVTGMTPGQYRAKKQGNND